MNGERMAGNKINWGELQDWTEISNENLQYKRKTILVLIWKIASNRIWCYMRWNIEVVFTKDNIKFINILKFIFFNSKLKIDDSGIKVFRHTLVLIWI